MKENEIQKLNFKMETTQVKLTPHLHSNLTTLGIRVILLVCFSISTLESNVEL